MAGFGGRFLSSVKRVGAGARQRERYATLRRCLDRGAQARGGLARVARSEQRPAGEAGRNPHLWALLANLLAYKLKQPVRLPFFDFTTLAARRRFCEEESRRRGTSMWWTFATARRVRGSVAAGACSTSRCACGAFPTARCGAKCWPQGPWRRATSTRWRNGSATSTATPPWRRPAARSDWPRATNVSRDASSRGSRAGAPRLHH